MARTLKEYLDTTPAARGRLFTQAQGLYEKNEWTGGPAKKTREEFEALSDLQQGVELCTLFIEFDRQMSLAQLRRDLLVEEARQSARAKLTPQELELLGL